MTTIQKLFGIRLMAAAVLATAGLGLGCADDAPPAPPPPIPFRPTVVMVALGENGGSVTLTSTEAGGWVHDGEAVTSGTVLAASNGSMYRLTLQGTTWSAEFVPPDPVQVPLGSSGTTVLLQQQEDPSAFTLNGDPVEDGSEVRATNGLNYELRFRNGMWDAVLAGPVMVTLGQFGGRITLVRDQNGQWRYANRIVQNGDVVIGANAHEYRLSLVADRWTAEPLGIQIAVDLPGTSQDLILTRLEDGTYRLDGIPVRSGEVVEVGDQSYRLQLSGGRWTASFEGIVGTGSDEDSFEAFVGTRPTLTDAAGDGTREGSILVVNGVRYEVADLFDTGYQATESTFVERARTEIERTLELVRRFVEQDLDSALQPLWDDVDDELDKLVGDGDWLGTIPMRSGEIYGRGVINEIEDVLDELSSPSEFEREFEGTTRRFSDVTLAEGQDPDDIYDTVASTERIGFGFTSHTRFGAFSRRERTDIGGTLTGSQGSFAYSTWDELQTRDLPGSGEASYVGGTVATDGSSDQEVYRGTIQLVVDFDRLVVDGVVTDLVDRRGDPWEFSFRPVERIDLPTARLSRTSGAFSVRSADTDEGRVVFSLASGSPRPRQIDGELDGQFVGPSSASRHAVIGTWEVSRSIGVIDALRLTGAFGAEEDGEVPTVPTRPPPVVVVDPVDGDPEISRTHINARPDSNGDIEIAALDSSGDEIELAAADLAANDGAVLRGPSRLGAVVERIEASARRLRTFRDVLPDPATGLGVRQSEWNRPNMALRDLLISLDTRTTMTEFPFLEDPYSGTIDSERALERADRDALDILDDVVAALRDEDDYDDAFGTRGVFNPALDEVPGELEYYEFDDLEDSLDYEVVLEFGSTDFGYFGAWSKTAPGSDGTVSLVRGDEAPNVFAYSSVEQTVYSSNTDDHPVGFRGRYAGRTLAVHTGTGEIFSGDIDLEVEWGSTVVNSQVTASISSLFGSESGRYEYDNRDVSEILISRVDVQRPSPSRRVGFNDSSIMVEIQHVGSRTTPTIRGNNRIEGKFVGDTRFDGPQGLIGVWDFEMLNLRGAFSADLGP